MKGPCAILPSSSALYRKLIKAYINKFDTHEDVIVRAWIATKEHFHRNAQLRDLEEIRKAKEFGLEIHRYITCGIIMAYEKHNQKGKKYLKISQDILKASNNHVDPVTAQGFLEKFKDYIDPKEKEELTNDLKHMGLYSEKAAKEAQEQGSFKTRSSRRNAPLVKDL